MNEVSNLHVEGVQGDRAGSKAPSSRTPFFLANSLQPFLIAKYQALSSLSPSLFLLLPTLSSLPPMPFCLTHFPKLPPLRPPLQTYTCFEGERRKGAINAHKNPMDSCNHPFLFINKLQRQMLKYTYLKGQMQTDYHLEPSLEKSPFLWMSVLAVWQNKRQEKKLISPALLHLIKYLNNIAQH